MKKIYPFSMLLLAVLLLSNCGNKEQKCALGKPTAIFNPTMTGVRQHQFELQNNNASIETVTFQNGVTLTFLQSGCDHLRQVFSFSQQGNFEKMDDAAWKNLAIQHFEEMTKLVPAFSQWVGVLKSASESAKLGQNIEIQQNTYLKIDKIKGGNMASVIVEVNQN